MYQLDTYEDLVMRLDKTVCLYKGIACYVTVRRRADGNLNTVAVSSIRDKGKTLTTDVRTDDKDFFVSGFSGGFLNTRFGKGQSPTTYYMARPPARQQRQGFSFTHITLDMLGLPNLGGAPAEDFQLQHNVGLADLFENTYPNHRHVLAKVLKEQGKSASMAFARNWALWAERPGDIRLFYQTLPVGRYSIKNETFIVNTDLAGLSFVLPELTELGINYAIS